jgi:peptide/nickel transport system permease protein/dipeptide transport system permease protein
MKQEYIMFLRRFGRNQLAVVGFIVVVLFLIVGVFAPLFAPNDPLNQSLYDKLISPSSTYLLGTDDLGRDILSRIIYGARISLIIGIVSVGISLLVGVPLGLVAGYYGGFWGSVIMRIMDLMLSLPAILLAVVIVAVLGPSLTNAMIAIGIVNVPTFARLTRSMVVLEKEKEYATAAIAIGCSNIRVMTVAILPNCLAPLIVQSSLGFATAVLEAAALSFVGLGAQPPTPEWGAMLTDGKNYFYNGWWVMTFPGIAILFTVLGFNLLGDGLRDVLDPRLKR